ncbi:MAG: hypothetical protein AVDCRST_MAG29-143, partial [uncultured Nocardioidaceae bacterium]
VSHPMPALRTSQRLGVPSPGRAPDSTGPRDGHTGAVARLPLRTGQRRRLAGRVLVSHLRLPPVHQRRTAHGDEPEPAGGRRARVRTGRSRVGLGRRGRPRRRQHLM